VEKKMLGASGIEVSAIGFGGMRLPAVSESEAMATLERAVELGITLYETGHGYGSGSSQRQIGRATEGSREGLLLFNKAGIGSAKARSDIRAQMDRALADERTDRFDCFSLWGVNNAALFERCRKLGFFDELRSMREEGLTRLIGITTHAQPGEIVRFVDSEKVDVVTLKYNMLHRRQEGTIAELSKRGIGVLVMNPLAGGMVARPGAALAAEFERAGISPAVLGLRFHTSNGGVSAPIAGMNSPAMVEENVRAATRAELSPAERSLVERVEEALADFGEETCTGCGYCLPCPEGVGIPGILALWNMQRGWGSDSYTRGEYAKMIDGNHWAEHRGKSADHCADCGECEERCPNSLPIRELLKRAHEEMTS
jgi:hypothetical protein